MRLPAGTIMRRGPESRKILPDDNLEFGRNGEVTMTSNIRGGYGLRTLSSSFWLQAGWEIHLPYRYMMFYV